jgi:hypothetical protein
VSILALGIFAPGHEVKKAGDAHVHFLLVGKATVLGGEFAFAHGVEDAGFAAEVVGKAALVALGAVVLVVEFTADVFGGFGFDDLSFDGVGEEAIEAVLAVAHVVVDAGVAGAFDVVLVAEGVVGAFVDGEVLFGAEVLDVVQLEF